MRRHAQQAMFDPLDPLEDHYPTPMPADQVEWWIARCKDLLAKAADRQQRGPAEGPFSAPTMADPPPAMRVSLGAENRPAARTEAA